jgi:hypothetical protein
MLDVTDASVQSQNSVPETKEAEDVVAVDDAVPSDGQEIETHNIAASEIVLNEPASRDFVEAVDKSLVGAIELSTASVVEEKDREEFDSSSLNIHASGPGSIHDSLLSGEGGVLVNEGVNHVAGEKLEAISVVESEVEKRGDGIAVVTETHKHSPIEDNADGVEGSLTKQTGEDHSGVTTSSSGPHANNGRPFVEDVATKIHESSPSEQNAGGGSSTKLMGEDHSEGASSNSESSDYNREARIEGVSAHCSSLPSNAPCEGANPAKRSRGENPQDYFGNKRLCTGNLTVAQISSDGVARHSADPSVDREVAAIETISRRLDLEGVKLAIFELGKRVHKGNQCDVLFMQYWAAISLTLSGSLSMMEMARNQLIIKRFIKGKKLRILHNKLILGE